MEKLAIFGGEKTKTTPFGRGKRFGDEELAELKTALDSNTLFYWAGGQVKKMCAKFAEMYGKEYCVGVSSGTAAIHTALGTLGVGPGDEVITSPITDMGSIIGILYQNAIPVFSDVDPYTYNMDAASIESKITPRTKCILVVHLAGNPADMDAIMAVAKKHGVHVVEDCAQSYCCTYKGKLCGTFGDIGCFSLNDFKHISAGDGGMCIMNGEELYKKAHRFADKNYNRFGGTLREIPYLAPNYRMNELTASVALAQLDKVEDICAKRNAYGKALTKALSGIKGLYTPKITDGCESSYWFYMLRINAEEFGATRDQFAEALRAEGIPAGAGYIPGCVYEYDLFRKRNVYDNTRCVFDCPLYGTKIDYGEHLSPVAEEVLKTAVKLNMNEFYTEQDLSDTISAIKKIAEYYSKK